MKKLTIFLIFIGGTVVAQNNLSTEAISFGGKQLSFNKAYKELESGIRGNPQSQVMVLSALLPQPSLAKGTSLLTSIVNIAIAGEDYSLLDTEIIKKRTTQNDEPPTNPAILAVIERAGVRDLALQIAVANGSPEAISIVPILEKSKSPTEQAISKKAAHYLSLYGTPNIPKRGPFVLFTKEVSEETYVTAINERFSSPDIKKQISGVESIIGNLNFHLGKEESTNFLIKLLRPFFQKHIGTTDIAIQSIEGSALRAVLIAGGSEAKPFLTEASEDTNPRVAQDASKYLGEYSIYHEEPK